MPKTEDDENKGKTEDDDKGAEPEDGADDDDESSGADDEGDDDDEDEGVEGEGGDDDDPEPKPKKTAKERRRELAGDPEVKRMVKRERDKAVRRALEEQARDDEKKRAREKMDTEERAKAETKEASERAEKAEATAKAVSMELDFYKAMAGAGSKLADPDDAEYIQRLASKMVENEDADDWNEAIEAIRAKKPHLFAGAADPDDDDGEPVIKPRKRKPKASTGPAIRRTSGDPVGEDPPKTKSAKEMTKPEFAAHRRSLGFEEH